MNLGKTQANPRNEIPQVDEGGNEERLGEDVDRGLLLQSSKDQRVWVEGLGDLFDLSFCL